MDCFGFCGEKCSKKKKKTKEKYKEEVNKETNEMPVPLRNEIQFPGSAEDVQQIETTSESLLQASQETGDLCPHVVPSGVGNPASLDHNVNQVSDEMPNKSRTEQTMKLTHDVKKKKPSKPKHRHYQNNQDSSDSETDSSSDSSCDESSSADDSNDSPVERTSTSKTKKKSRTKIINAPGGIVDFGRNNKNKIVHISYGGQKKKKKNKDKDRSSRSHIGDAEPHMNRTQTEHDFPGNFHKICDETDTISNMEMIVEVAKSVGIIRSPLVQGTGFRVGDSYIMTANHVVEGIINPVLQPLDDRERGQKLKLLGDRKVHIDFDFKLPVDASQQGQVVQGNTLRFNFEPQILYQNKALDTAVLKLKHSSSKFPHQLTRFCHCLENLPMYFIGHSNHEVKKFDKTNPRDLTESEIKQCQIWSKQHQIGCRENYRGYEGAADPRKILFDCSATFNKGASGSPGFIVSSHDKMPYVVSMLLRGYPDWYHDEKVKEKMCIPREYSFEQGVRITEVYKDMKANNPGLCSEIFGT